MFGMRGGGCGARAGETEWLPTFVLNILMFHDIENLILCSSI